MKIVLVHGIFNTGHIFFFMKWMLQRCGFECFAPNLWPIDGRKGIEYASGILKEKINERFGETDKIVLIGFSMGGVVARYYLQSLGGSQRTLSFFSISAPFKGTWWAYIPYPSKSIKQMRPNSDFLKKLDKVGETLTEIKLYSYWTPIDTSIVPSSSSYWNMANNKKIFSILHITMIFSTTVTKEIIRNLQCNMNVSSDKID